MVNGTMKLPKIHPTTPTKGDVSCLQCKAVGSYLQDPKRITARKSLSDVYREHLKAIIHQAVGVMLSCNGLSLDYAIVLYDKTRSKIEIVQSIINELPKPPGSAYFLSDS